MDPLPRTPPRPRLLRTASARNIRCTGTLAANSFSRPATVPPMPARRGHRAGGTAIIIPG